MIKEADVFINGLTVIAGENDTGKSTVGKALYIAIAQSSPMDNNATFMQKYMKLIDLLFDGKVSDKDGFIVLSDNDQRFEAEFSVDQKYPVVTNFTDTYTVSVVETPLVWNFFKFFNAIEKIKTEASFFDQKYDIPYPYLMWDLYKKLSLARKDVVLADKVFFLEKMKSIMNGQFVKDDFGDFVYKAGEKNIPIINTATGIKQFGILQKLIENNYIHHKSILVYDEPEVHLHPKWQLKMAEILVLLVHHGVKIVVNSHSPYMIEALKRYSDREKIEADFYLAENGYVTKKNDSNSQTLVEIYEKLSEPYDAFEEMENIKMEHLLNG